MNVGTWVDQIRETLSSNTVEQVNKLASPFTVGDQTLSMRYPLDGAFAKGVTLCVGMNAMLVWSATESTSEVVVEPGWAGSPVEHAPTDSLVRIRPAVYTHRIVDTINDVLAELSSPIMGIYSVGTIDLDYSPTVSLYDLTEAESLLSVIEVQIGEPDDPTSEWRTLSSVTDWSLRTTAPTIEVPSGRQLETFGPLIGRDNGTVLRVTYRAGLNAVDSLTDDVSMTGLPASAYDLPVLGAAARLAFPQEYKRNALESQPDTRRAQEVPPGSRLGAARALQQRYEVRVDQEAARLIAAHPWRQN